MADLTPSRAPNGAAGSSAVAVAVAGLTAWAVQTWLRVPVPPDVQLELSILAAFVGTYLHPDGRQ